MLICFFFVDDNYMGRAERHMSAAVFVPHSASPRRGLAERHEFCLMQHGSKDTRMPFGYPRAHQDFPGSPERGECHQMGPARPSACLLLRWHDLEGNFNFLDTLLIKNLFWFDFVYKDLDPIEGHLGAQSTGACQRDLHNQMESDWTRHQQSQLEPHTGERQLRLDGSLMGRGTWRMSAYTEQAYRARLLSRVQSRRQIPCHWLFWQVCQHMEHCSKSFNPFLNLKA